MKTLSLFPLPVAFLVATCGLCAQDASGTAAAATEVVYSRASVVERSPFAQSVRARKGATGDALELRGFYGTGSDLQVSLTRPDTKEAAWIAVGDKNAKWVVESADADAGTAEVNFDGLRLHLTLAKAEVPEVGESRRSGGGRWGGNMSEEGRRAMHETMRAGFDKARTEHPEWFDGRKLNEQQQGERRAYMQNGWNRAKAAVAAVSQVDAQQMGEAPSFIGGVSVVTVGNNNPAAGNAGPLRGNGNISPGNGSASGGNTSGGSGRGSRRGRGGNN